MTGTEIFEVSSEQQQELIQWLTPYIPTCIALYRRIQFGHFEPGAVILSSVDFASPAHERKPQDPWIIAYVDRACRPETEVWVAASWEQDTPTDDSWVSHADGLVKAMIKKISQLETPPKAGAIVEPEKAKDQPSATNGSVLADRDQFLSHMQNENIVLFGSVHRATFTILQRLGFIDPNSAEVSGIPYRKYIFDIKNNMVSRDLPPGFEYGKVDPKDYSLVKSRTQIPRQDRTLCKLPSVAIYPNNNSSTTREPVAWGFLGLDASLTTLHVEPAYRGLGLAKSLSLKLFSDDMEIYCQHNPTPTKKDGYTTERYAHADVATDNRSSQGVCESLGGKWSFEVFWIRVDLLA